MPTMAILIGIPGSGKSTFCKEYFCEYERVNLDTLHTRNKEKICIEQAFSERRNIIIDNTNPTVGDRVSYIQRAKMAGYRVEGYFMQSVFNDCLTRNNMRSGKEKLPRKAIASISKILQMPTLDEGFDELFFVSITDKGFNIDEWRTE